MISSTPLLSFFFFYPSYWKTLQKVHGLDKKNGVSIATGTERLPFGVAHRDSGSTAMAQLETREQKQGGNVLFREGARVMTGVTDWLNFITTKSW